MKKRNLLCILLAAMMLTSLSGCGGSSTADKGSDDSSHVSRREQADKKDDDDDDDDSKDDDSSRDDAADESSSDDSGNDKADSSSSKDSADDDRGSSSGRDESSSDSSKAPESSTANSGSSSADTGSQSDYEAAEAVLKTFLDAVQRNDRDGILKNSDLSKYFEMCKVIYEADEEDDFDELLEELLDSMFDDTGLESYTIGAGELHKEIVEDYELFLAQAQEEMDEMLAESDAWDEYDEAEYDLLLQILEMYPTITKVYAFEVTEVIDGDTETEYLLVAYEDGAWKVDVVFLAETVGYPDEFDVY